MFTRRVIRQFGRVLPFKNLQELSLVAGFENPSLHRNFQRNSTSMCEASQDSPKDRIVWMDMEMTGLDISKDHIMEVAVIVTDQDLNTVALGPELTINLSDRILDSMDEWCTKHHGQSGLTAACRRSKLSTGEAEQQVLEFLSLHVPAGSCPLAGNSVYMDRLFLRCRMPLVDAHLHHRIVDVSTVKELCRRWSADLYAGAPAKQYGHRALADIRESIEELRYYRKAIFQGRGPAP